MLAALKVGKPVVTPTKNCWPAWRRALYLAEAQGVDLYSVPVSAVASHRPRPARRVIGKRHRLYSRHSQRTCNYILTRMEQEGLPLTWFWPMPAPRLCRSQPALDTMATYRPQGRHSGPPLLRLPRAPLRSGCRGHPHLDGSDVQFARELGYRIKLLARVARVDDASRSESPRPCVPLDHSSPPSPASSTPLVHSDLTDDTLYYGRGAGREPTASTVIGRHCRYRPQSPHPSRAIGVPSKSRLSRHRSDPARRPGALSICA